MKKLYFPTLVLSLTLFAACKSDDPEEIAVKDLSAEEALEACETRVYPQTEVYACGGEAYPAPGASPYTLPFVPGHRHWMGLSNCSQSFHAPGEFDQYAYDFDLPENYEFLAARAGVVSWVEKDQPSGGGGIGNYLAVDHGDGTYGLYMHSPQDGILVTFGDTVEVGQPLGLVGRSGTAGYSHLHFIVLTEGEDGKNKGIPVTFNNAYPPDIVLESFKQYISCD